MSSLRRERGRVIFTRPGQTPGLHAGIYYFFLLATALCSPLIFFVEPFYAAMASTMVGIGALAMGLLDMSTRVSTGGRLLQVRKHFELVSPTSAEGYRDAPSEAMLEFDGRRFPKSKVREVVLGHYFTMTGGNQEHHFWPVYLVLDEHVIEIAILGDKGEALRLRREISELFDVPMRERETGIFGEGVGAGCLNGLLTIGLDLVLLSLPVAVLTTLGMHAAAPVPALVALLMWLNHRITPTLFARGIRAGVDEQVAQTFELTGPKVRVEAGRTFQDVADELRAEREAAASEEAEAEAEAEA